MAEAGRRGASGAGGGKAPALPELERQVGTMALSQIEGAGSLALMRAVAWHGVLARLGVAAPLVVIHDLGCLISGAGAPASVTRGIAEAELCEAWRLLLVELADAELVRSQAAWKHRDAMVGVVLARILTSVIPQLPEAVRVLRPIELPTDAAHYLRIEPSTAFTPLRSGAGAGVAGGAGDEQAPADPRGLAARCRRAAALRALSRGAGRRGRGGPRGSVLGDEQPGAGRRDRLLDGALAVDPRGAPR
jgi:hypothetical protein